MLKKNTQNVFLVLTINRMINNRRRTRKQTVQAEATLSHNIPIVATQIITTPVISEQEASTSAVSYRANLENLMKKVSFRYKVTSNKVQLCSRYN